MTVPEFLRLVESIKYKPEFTFKGESIGGYVKLQMSAKVLDSDRSGRHTKVNVDFRWDAHELEYRTKEEVIWAISDLIRGFEIHEMDEWLMIDDKQLHNPHENDR